MTDNQTRPKAAAPLEGERPILQAPNGKFLPGTRPGPGVPKGRLNPWQIAVKHAQAEGLDLEAAVWAVLKMMLTRGALGDTKAAKVALDHLCPAHLPGQKETERLTAEETLRRLRLIVHDARARGIELQLPTTLPDAPADAAVASMLD